MVDILFDVINLSLKEEESHVKEQALNIVINSFGQLLLLKISVNGVTFTLSEFVHFMQIWEGLKGCSLSSWKGGHVDLLTNIKLESLRLVRSWICDMFLSQEMIKVGFLWVVPTNDVSEHGHQVLLRLHMMGLVTIIVL